MYVFLINRMQIKHALTSESFGKTDAEFYYSEIIPISEILK